MLPVLVQDLAVHSVSCTLCSNDEVAKVAQLPIARPRPAQLRATADAASQLGSWASCLATASYSAAGAKGTPSAKLGAKGKAQATPPAAPAGAVDPGHALIGGWWLGQSWAIG